MQLLALPSDLLQHLDKTLHPNVVSCLIITRTPAAAASSKQTNKTCATERGPGQLLKGASIAPREARLASMQQITPAPLSAAPSTETAREGGHSDSDEQERGAAPEEERSVKSHVVRDSTSPACVSLAGVPCNHPCARPTQNKTENPKLKRTATGKQGNANSGHQASRPRRAVSPCSSSPFHQISFSTWIKLFTQMSSHVLSSPGRPLLQPAQNKQTKHVQPRGDQDSC